MSASGESWWMPWIELWQCRAWKCIEHLSVIFQVQTHFCQAWLVFKKLPQLLYYQAPRWQQLCSGNSGPKSRNRTENNLEHATLKQLWCNRIFRIVELICLQDLFWIKGVQKSDLEAAINVISTLLWSLLLSGKPPTLLKCWHSLRFSATLHMYPHSPSAVKIQVLMPLNSEGTFIMRPVYDRQCPKL